MRSIKWQDVGRCSALPRALNNHSRPRSKSEGIRKIQANPGRRHKPSTPRSECHCSPRAMAGSTKHNAQLGLQADRENTRIAHASREASSMHCARACSEIESQAASDRHPIQLNTEAKPIPSLGAIAPLAGVIVGFPPTSLRSWSAKACVPRKRVSRFTKEFFI
jgi:hypothetical protein